MSLTPKFRHPFSLAGRIALVTGAGRGLGFEMAKAMAAAGAHVVINGRDATRLEASARAIMDATGGSAGIAAFDVADFDAARAAIDAIVRAHGRLDILVNNVGARDRRALETFGAEDARRLLETDLLAPLLLAREAAEIMKRQNYGRLIMVTSIAGHVSNRDDPVYTSAKAGLTGLTRSLAVDYARAGITSNAIAPGMFATETNRSLVENADFSRFVDVRVPIGRWGKPEEIAGAAVFLASEEASFVNGHVLVVDGGQTIRM